MKRSKMMLVVAMMIFSGSLFAEDVRSDKKMGKRPSMMRYKKIMIKALDLTDDQKVQMKDIHKANSTKMKDANMALAEARKALQEEASNEDVNESAIKTLSSQLADAIALLAITKAEMKKEVKAILTDEQKETFDKTHERIKARMSKMKEMGKRIKSHRNKKSEGESKGGCEGGCEGGC